MDGFIRGFFRSGSGVTMALMSRASEALSRSKFRWYGICEVIEPTGETLDRRPTKQHDDYPKSFGFSELPSGERFVVFLLCFL